MSTAGNHSDPWQRRFFVLFALSGAVVLALILLLVVFDSDSSNQEERTIAGAESTVPRSDARSGAQSAPVQSEPRQSDDAQSHDAEREQPADAQATQASAQPQSEPARSVREWETDQAEYESDDADNWQQSEEHREYQDYQEFQEHEYDEYEEAREDARRQAASAQPEADEDDRGERQEYTDQEGGRQQSEDASEQAVRSGGYAEVEGSVVAVSGAVQTFRLRVDEAEYVGGAQIPAEITVALSSGRALPSWLSAGRWVEVEGRYDDSAHTLYAAELELASSVADDRYESSDEQELEEDEDEEREYEDYDDSSDDDDRYAAYAEFEGRVASVNAAADEFRLSVYEVEYVGGVQVPAEITVTLSSGRPLPTWLSAGRRVEVEGRYDDSAHTLYAAELELASSVADDRYESSDEQELEYEDDEHEYEDYDDSSEDDDRYAAYAEFEGRVASVNAAADEFRLSVYEVEYVGGAQVPAEITVALSSGRPLPSWLREGRWVEAEGRYDSAADTLYAVEIELEDD